MNFNNKIVTDGLVLCLDAADTKSYPGSGTIWYDRTKNKNNGTLTNGPTFNSGNGGSIVFDGSNDIVTTSYKQSSTAFTWSIWFKTNVLSDGTYRNIMSIPSPNYILVLLNSNNSNFGFWTSDSLGGESLSTPTLSTGVWYNIVFIREGNSITNGYKAYVNSRFYGSANTGTWSSTDVLSIGGRTDVSQYLNGNVSNILIYNRILSAVEILQNFNAQRKRFNI